MLTQCAQITSYHTLDGSEIRELMHPDHQPVLRQSLALAEVAPGRATRPHLHRIAEELYHVLAGHGRMTLGAQQFPVREGDTVLIPPGTPHHIENVGSESLRFLCCCSPAYRHEDTELLEISGFGLYTNAAALL